MPCYDGKINPVTCPVFNGVVHKSLYRPFFLQNGLLFKLRALRNHCSAIAPDTICKSCPALRHSHRETILKEIRTSPNKRCQWRKFLENVRLRWSGFFEVLRELLARFTRKVNIRVSWDNTFGAFQETAWKLADATQSVTFILKLIDVT